MAHMPGGFNPHLSGNAMYFFYLAHKNMSSLVCPNPMYIFEGYIQMEFVLAFFYFKSCTCLS